MKRIDEKIENYLSEKSPIEMSMDQMRQDELENYEKVVEELNDYLDRQIKFWKRSNHTDEAKRAVLLFIKQMKRDLDFGRG